MTIDSLMVDQVLIGLRRMNDSVLSVPGMIDDKKCRVENGETIE